MRISLVSTRRGPAPRSCPHARSVSAAGRVARLIYAFLLVAALAPEARTDAGGPDQPTARGSARAPFLLEFQWDTRGFPLVHLDFLHVKPGRFSTNGFIDWQGRPGMTGADHLSLRRHVGEVHHARWFARRFAIDAELNDGSKRPVRARLGVRWYPPISLGPRSRLFVRLSPLQTGGKGGQVSAVGGGVLTSRLSWSFWADLNTTRSVGGDSQLISEVKLRYRRRDGSSLTLEFRQNAFLPSGQQTGLALGVEFPLR